jgi:hypothetical protein
MKRSEVLTEIKWAGWHGNLDKAATLIRQKGIGAAASRKAYIDGQKAKERGARNLTGSMSLVLYATENILP